MKLLKLFVQDGVQEQQDPGVTQTKSLAGYAQGREIWDFCSSKFLSSPSHLAKYSRVFAFLFVSALLVVLQTQFLWCRAIEPLKF